MEADRKFFTAVGDCSSSKLPGHDCNTHVILKVEILRTGEAKRGHDSGIGHLDAFNRTLRPLIIPSFGRLKTVEVVDFCASARSDGSLDVAITVADKGGGDGKWTGKSAKPDCAIAILDALVDAYDLALCDLLDEAPAASSKRKEAAVVAV